MSALNLNSLSPAVRAVKVKQLLAKPATRAALPDKYLTPDQLTRRVAIRAARTPVAPGLTLGDLNAQTKAAVTQMYGARDQALGQKLAGAQQLQKDTPGWYDSYLSDLRQHSANVAANEQQAQAQMQAYGPAIRGLDQSALNDVAAQQRAQQAVTGGQASPQVGQDASNASTVRQAFLNSFGAMMAGQGAANSNYADTLAHVVGPGQKLQGLATAAGRVSGVRAEQAKLADLKGALATTTQTKLINDANTRDMERSVIYGKQASQAAADQRAARDFETKYGVSPQEWDGMTPAQRAGQIKGFKESSTPTKPMSATDKLAQARLDFFNKNGYFPSTGPLKHPGRPTSGPGSLTTSEQNKLTSVLDDAVSQARQLKSHMGQAQVRQTLLAGVDSTETTSNGKKVKVKIPKFNTWAVNAAMDVAFQGGLSAPNVTKLHGMGLSINGKYPTLTAKQKAGKLLLPTAKQLGLKPLQKVG